MSVTPKDFLDSASSLVAQGIIDEITQRNVVSRAYYAAFHRSCEFVEPAYSSSSLHKSYINQLNRGGLLERQISGILKRMHGRRVTADYHLDENLKKDAVALQILAANELFTKLSN